MSRSLGALILIVAVSCGGSGPPVAEPGSTTLPIVTSSTGAANECAHVIDATVSRTDAGYRVDATVRSADTGWEKYADAWEVRTLSGEVLATRVLAHPHETEQPFTRSLDGVVIPPGTTEVLVAAHDSVAGFCGTNAQVLVPTR